MRKRTTGHKPPTKAALDEGAWRSPALGAEKAIGEQVPPRAVRLYLLTDGAALATGGLAVAP